MTSKRSLGDLMRESGHTVSSIAANSGLSELTVKRALRGDSQERVNTTSARLIAETLGWPIEDINWPGGIANQGRPALSGGKYNKRTN